MDLEVPHVLTLFPEVAVVAVEEEEGEQEVGVHNTCCIKTPSKRRLRISHLDWDHYPESSTQLRCICNLSMTYFYMRVASVVTKHCRKCC